MVKYHPSSNTLISMEQRGRVHNKIPYKVNKDTKPVVFKRSKGHTSIECIVVNCGQLTNFSMRDNVKNLLWFQLTQKELLLNFTFDDST